MTQSASHPSIEPWQLTAYALNELEPSDAARVELALESDVALRGEFEQIQQTLTAVRTAFASTAANVGLSDSQTAVVSSQFEQLAAPKTITQGGLPPVATIKLAGRPFYRRKRFAALLATAAAIPLAATWMPSLFENDGPFALHVTDSTLSRSNAIDNAQLSRETDSSVATMADSSASMEAIGGNVQPEDQVVSQSLGTILGGPSDNPSVAKFESGKINLNTTEFEIDTAERRIKLSKDTITETLETKVRVPDGGTILLGGIKRLRNPKLSDSDAQDESKTEPFIPEEEEVAIGVNENSKMEGMASGNSGEAKMGGPVSAGKAIPPAPSMGIVGSSTGGDSKSGASRGGSMGGTDGGMSGGFMSSGGMSSGGMSSGGMSSGGMSSGGMSGGGMRGVGMSGGPGAGSPIPLRKSTSRSAIPSSVKNVREDRLELESMPLATRDKRLNDSDRQPIPLYQLPEDLRQNAPNLFRARATEQSGTDRFEKIVETPFLETQKAPLSTFSIDVDTASYSKIRQTIMEGNRLPSPDMVRIEEMVNYFEYGYEGPQDERPFAAHMSVDRCPWNTEHQLVRVGLQAKKLDKDKRVKANIVFLLDVSGSMNEPNKLPLVKKSLSMMVNQLNENDRVAIVVYAGAAGCVLPSTCGAEKQAILSSLEHLNAGGSTNGGQGIQLAYSIAKEQFIPGGANRVVLCTDGDFNVGVTGDDALVAMMQENAKSNIFLTCLGFGAGNYNDTMMEKISNKGNGIYGMIDNELEARRMMVEQLGGTLVTVAKDVKIQVDFNPAKVAGYRLIGYEDRRLANKDFDNDQKDAGEIGVGHRVTALYEVIPAGKWVGIAPPSESESSKYSKNPKLESSAEKAPNGEFPAELLTLKVRYKEPEGSVSTKQEFVLKETERGEQPLVDRDMQWATSVAEFGLLLRRSEMAPHADWTEMLERASSSAGGDAYRLECLAMMRKARSMFR